MSHITFFGSNDLMKRASDVSFTDYKVDNWRKQISRVDCALSIEQAERLAWRGESHNFELFVCGRLTVSEQVMYLDLATLSRYSTDHIIIHLIRRGVLIDLGSPQSTEIRRGDVVVIDSAQPSEYKLISIDGSGTLELFYWVIPRIYLETRCELASFHRSWFHTESFFGRLVGRHLETLLHSSKDLQPEQVSFIARGSIQLLSACFDAIEGNESIPPLLSQSPLARICMFIEKNLNDPSLDVTLIIKELGISRSRLYRFFEPYEGVSSYIRRRRLHRARQILCSVASRDMKLATVARLCGLDDANFSRLFQQAFSIAPGELRKKQQLEVGSVSKHGTPMLSGWACS